MITHIELTNFMSHTRTVIEPSPGLTVLIGPNNCGKSAVVAALQILCHNENSTYVTRHGEKECSVVVKTSDGHEVRWGRKNSPSYVINGQKFDRLRGSGLPDELHQALRLPKVDAGEANEFDVHFGTQKSPIFLLGSSEATAARFFASSSDAVHLVAMQRRHKEKHSQAKGKKQELEARSRALNEELEALQPVVDVDERLSRAELAYQELQEQAKNLESLLTLERKFCKQLDEIAHRAAEVEAVSSLLPPPSLTPTEAIEQLLLGLAQSGAAVSRLTALQEALAPLPSPPELGNVTALNESLSGIIAESHRYARAEADLQELKRLESPPQLQETDLLEGTIARMKRATSTLSESAEQEGVLRQLESPPQLDQEADLDRLLRSLQSGARNLVRWQAAVDAVAELPEFAPISVESHESLLLRLQELDEHVQSELKTFEAICAEAKTVEEELRAVADSSNCPTCGAPLDPDRVVSQAATGMGGHAHG